MGASAFAAVQLNRASDALSSAATALRRGDIDTASVAVAKARDAAGSARWFTQHPGFVLVGWLPALDRDAEALRDLIEVARQGSTLASSFVADLRRLGAADDGIASAIYADGRIDLDAVDEVASMTEDIDVLADDARVLLADDSDVTFGRLEQAVERADARVDSIERVAADAASMARLLPSFVGADEPRRYLLAFQSPSEARGGGGLIGVYGLLAAIDGRISLDEVGPIEDLGPRVERPVDAPPAFAATYGPLSALNDWRQANLSPNFPDTSEVLLDLFEQVRGERLDGVVAMDPIALGELTRGTGPIVAEGWTREVTPTSARRMLLFDVYRRFVHEERKQNAYLRALVDELWSRLETGDVDAAGLFEGFQGAASKHHIKIYSSNAAEQELLTDLNLTADPETVDGPLQLAFNNNNAGNKLDFFLHRTQRVAIELDPDGTAHVATAIQLTNDVPKHGLRAVARAGVRTGLGLGRSRMSMHFLLPRDARGVRMTVDGVTSDHFTGRDSGAAMVWDILEIAPEATVTVGLTYEIPEAVDDEGDFRFTLWPQATARPDRYTLELLAPEGYLLDTSRVPTGVGRTGRITRRGPLKAPVTLDAVVRPVSSREATD